GCTVFFSSHILADAEALCSRVAILAGGRLVADGRLSEILAFNVRGWELVVAGLDAGKLAGLEGRVAGWTRIAEDRYALELPAESNPERLAAELVSQGITLVSLNPVRDTLEDYFVKHVAGHQRAQA
ncbi:MAG: ABC transporter ATP-binding protein, partial [Acidobacteria bacterium]|nr:ABC transporter ATP-binding protein [Acidobacteriota bacterium]